MTSAKKNTSQYVDLNNNGKLFPLWVMKNFKKYKLPEILRAENEDPCNITVKQELRKYQTFIAKYIGPGSPYNEILLYHGMGSGKTANSINIMNLLHNYDYNYTFVILIKASLRDDPWMIELKKWLKRSDNESDTDTTRLSMYKNIHFVHYDSPFAGTDFLNIMKKLDTSKPIAFFIDEVHRFIQNVYSNITSNSGKRAQIIYEYIVNMKRENKSTKVICISATPAVNNPFELALLFNMLRPDIFPSSETEFNRIFVSDYAYPILSPDSRNMFQRRILGLVSYYIGATPDLYAKTMLQYVNLPMTQYQYGIYRVFEKIEAKIEEKARKFGKQSTIYRTYTRQASNFVYPSVSNTITGVNRPRPKDFNVEMNVAQKIEQGREHKISKSDKAKSIKAYISKLEEYLRETEQYFRQIHDRDVKTRRTIYDDLKDYTKGFFDTYGESFLQYYQSKGTKSKLFHELYKSSPKMLAIVFTTYAIPGKAMVYSSYVLGEGLEILKLYYRMIGFQDYMSSEPYLGYCEYHGKISKEDKIHVKKLFNSKDNIHGKKCRVILLSPSATEGIQLYNIKQEHILEPYWNEVRIDQVIGRGIRQCSHKDLPISERVVRVYRYRVTKPDKLDNDDKVNVSADEYVEDSAKAKDNLLGSFLLAMKEAAVDCELFAPHNKMVQWYPCFQFPEQTLLKRHIGPAYKKDIVDDMKYNSGTNAPRSRIERIKVSKIKAVYVISYDKASDKASFSEADTYWYYSNTGVVYDFQLHYPVGIVRKIDGIPNKLNKDTYIITDLIKIPTVEDSTNNL